MNQSQLLPNLFRDEYGKIVSVLCRSYGLQNLETAEDLVSETFLLASETWGVKGLPESPSAWLYKVATNKTKDYLKHKKIFVTKISPELTLSSPRTESELDLSREYISDSQLGMMFAICNPAIPVESQIGLALRILCGFGIDEIAHAFLTTKEVINKRLFRAKQKLRSLSMDIEVPARDEIKARLETVLTTIYLLFNEGYYSHTRDHSIQNELCYEAMRLNFLLIESKLTNSAKVNALMSLMCFHASRLKARTNENGQWILYENQNKELWDQQLIEKGNYFLNQSAVGTRLSKYHIEAAIAYWHTQSPSDDKWENVLQLYNSLLQIEYSPMAAINRTYALSRVEGKEVAIEEALKIDLKDNHLYHALVAELYDGIDKNKQIHHLNLSLKFAVTNIDKDSIREKLARSSSR